MTTMMSISAHKMILKEERFCGLFAFKPIT